MKVENCLIIFFLKASFGGDPNLVTIFGEVKYKIQEIQKLLSKIFSIKKNFKF